MNFGYGSTLFLFLLHLHILDMGLYIMTAGSQRLIVGKVSQKVVCLCDQGWLVLISSLNDDDASFHPPQTRWKILEKEVVIQR